MPSQGPNNPAAGVSTEAGFEDWASPDETTFSDDTYASSSLTLFTGNAFTDYLDCTNYGFSIPAGSTILGVVVEIEKRSDSETTIVDSLVQLIVGGTATGNNNGSSNLWPSSDTYETHGSSTDLWGLSLTAAQVNATDFGVRIQAQNPNFDIVPDSAYVDHVRITVYYIPSGAPQIVMLGVGM